MDKVLLELKNIVKEFPVSGNKKKRIQAVSDVSLKIYERETLALVGESGCGKSTLGRCAIGLLRPERGESLFRGENIFKNNHLKGLRRQMQIVFQDPYASLNPRMNLGHIIGEPIITHEPGTQKSALKEKVEDLMEEVGIPREYYFRYPHQFSGGQRQRVGIARALVVDPDFIVADEPVSALDVSIQAQVVNMFEDLQRDRGLTYLFIAHDLSIVNHISNRIGVMYLGKMVELSKSDDIVFHPLHPYTQSLISAIPVADPKTARQRNRIVLEGEVPSPLNPPSGCRFRTRCKYATKECGEQVPEWREIEKGHFVACHHAEEINS